MSNSNESDLKLTFTADQIDDYIWLGDLESAENYHALNHFNISHVLTVLHFEPKYPANDSRKRKYVHALDIEKTDLISQFDSCYQFIEEAVSNQNHVLIHCLAGMSRSATIACAYLMKKYLMSYEVALKRLTSKRSCVWPNAGFQRQLRLYHSLNYNVDNKSEETLTSKRDSNENNFDDLVPIGYNSNTYSIEYKCKLCRQTLFTDTDLVSHVSGKGRFDIQSRSSAYKAKQNAETVDKDYCRQELFTTQPPWLDDIYDKDILDGDILCPNKKCHAKLGRYSLVGEKCACAKWLNPAFHFHRSKIDECPIKTKDEIKNILSKRAVTLTFN